MDDARRAARERRDAERAGVREEVEDAPARREAPHEVAVLALVEEEAGLLAGGELRHEGEPLLAERRARGNRVAREKLVVEREPLSLPRRQVVLLDDGRPGECREERRQPERAGALGALRRRLHDENAAVAVRRRGRAGSRPPRSRPGSRPCPAGRRVPAARPRRARAARRTPRRAAGPRTSRGARRSARTATRIRAPERRPRRRAPRRLRRARTPSAARPLPENSHGWRRRVAASRPLARGASARPTIPRPRVRLDAARSDGRDSSPESMREPT